jgi:phosphoenolpyruvate carboxykinase (ATP)
VPAAVLNPRHTWPNSQEYDQQAHKLAGMFVKNFEKYSEGVSAEVIQAGPKG